MESWERGIDRSRLYGRRVGGRRVGGRRREDRGLVGWEGGGWEDMRVAGKLGDMLKKWNTLQCSRLRPVIL